MRFIQLSLSQKLICWVLLFPFPAVRPVLPLRFLSLIPLSHMFGQVLTMFILPLIPGTAVFMHGYSPHEIVRQIRSRRVSVLVAVPKILEVLRKYILHQFPETAHTPPAASHWVSGT